VFVFWQGQDIFSFSKTLSSLQLVPGTFSSGLKQLEHEDDYSSPSSAKVNEWSCTSVLPAQGQP